MYQILIILHLWTKANKHYSAKDFSNKNIDPDNDYSQFSFKRVGASQCKSQNGDEKYEEKPNVNRTFEAKFQTINNRDNSQKYCSRLSDIRELYK